MRKITQIPAVFTNSLESIQSRLCLEKDFWTQKKTIMKQFQLSLMQYAYEHINTVFQHRKMQIYQLTRQKLSLCDFLLPDSIPKVTFVSNDLERTY